MLVISYAASAEAPGNLTGGEAQVARLAADGRSNAEIAKARGTAARTVANQMASILRKLGLSSRRELATLYHGHVSPNRSSK
jgi:DNA-binding CsgD family transcriptional regulator